MRIMSVDDLLFLNEKNIYLFWHKMRLKMHFCCLNGLCANFVNFRMSKIIFVKIVQSKCDFGKIER